MRKLLKIIGITLGVIVLVLVVAGVGIALFVDAEDFKGPITEQVEKRTGRSLTLAGPLDLSVFPWLGVELQKATLGNAKGFGPEPFARIEKAQVRAKLVPLIFGGQLEVDTVVLDGLVLNLGVDKNGRSNWADLAAGGEAAAPDKPAEGGGASPLAGLALGGVKLRNARVSYADAQSGQQVALAPVNLTVGAIQPGEPFDVDLQTDFDARTPQKLTGQMGLAGQVRIDPAFENLNVKGTRLTLDARGEGLPAPVEASLRGDLALDLAREQLTVNGLRLTAQGVEVTGALDGEKVMSNPAFAGELRIRPFSPRDLLERLGQSVPETADSKVLDRAQAAFDLKATPTSVALESLSAELDDTTLNGRFAVTDLAAAALRFDLAVDAIDIDRYLPPQAEDAEAGTPAAASAGAAGALPVETLRALDIQGKLHIGQLTAYGLRSSDVNVTISADDGLVQVHPSTAKLYDGTYRGNVRIDARNKAPSFAIDEALESVAIGKLLADLYGTARLTGTANVSSQLQGTGATVDAIRKDLDGKLGFSVNDGALQGVNIAQLIRNAKARLEGRPVPKQSGPQQTDFTSLSATAKVRDGVLRNDDLQAKSPLFRIAGAGKVDLVRQSIDYRVETSIVGTLEGQGGQGLTDLKGVTVPIRITGSLLDPSFGVDLKTVVEDRVKDKVKDRVREELGERLGGKQDKKKGEDAEQPASPEEQLERKLEEGVRGLFR